LKDQGISIKILSTDEETVVQDLIRGSKVGKIYDMVFSHDDKYLAVLSHTGTLHIFKLNLTKYLKKESEEEEKD
jgi:hypothetical protein